MTAGHIYTVAGTHRRVRHHGRRRPGHLGAAAAIRPASRSMPAGNVYIADSANNRIQEVAAGTHTQWGQRMPARRHLHDRRVRDRRQRQ